MRPDLSRIPSLVSTSVRSLSNQAVVRLHMVVVAMLCIATVSGCSSGSEPAMPVSADNPIEVVATTSMIADLVRVIGGPFVKVKGLMGPNVDPHLYKASEGDVSAMTKAQLVFYNGLHLEGKMVDIFEQMTSRGLEVHAVTEVFESSELLESDYFAGNHDPHFWFDVVMWEKVAGRVAGILSTFDPVHEATYTSNLIAYQSDLDSLNAWIHVQIESLDPEKRVLVTSHDAFGYFGRAYGIEVFGLQGLSTATEAGTADVQAMASLVAERKIPAMFVESSISPRGIEAVRAAVRDRGFDVQIGGTLFGDALGSPGTGAETYLGMVRANVNTFVNAMSNGKPGSN